MGFKLFDVAKVGCYCESITHSTEKRKDGEVKVLQLSLKVDPFDVKLATALSLPVRTTLFKLGNAEPHEHLRKVYVTVGAPRQQMQIFATPDTPKASILFDHVRIAEIYARTSKDARGFVLIFKVIFGPPDARELEYSENWRNNMAFVTFTEAEASDLFIDSADEDEPEDDKQQALPDPEFETDGAGKPLDAPPAREREHARHAKPRHADRKSAAKAKQKGGRKR